MCLDKSLEAERQEPGGELGDPRVASPILYKGQRRLALWHRTGASEGPELYSHGSSDPMREAGAPST